MAMHETQALLEQLRAASSALEAGRAADARAHAENVLRAVEDESALLIFGIASARLGDHPAAIAALSRATELNPGRAAAHSHLAESHAALGAYPEAKRAFRKALELDPANAVHFEQRLVLCGRAEYFRAAQRGEGAIHRDVASLLDEVSAASERGDFAQAFGTLMLFAQQIGQQQQNAAPFFSGSDVALGSRELDGCIDALGAQVLKRRGGARARSTTKRTVYLATQLYPVGGHTRVIRSYMNADETREHIVLVTDLAHNQQLRTLVEPMFEGRKLEWCPAGDSMSKLHWLMDRLEELAPERVILFQHHHDALAVAACQPELVRDLYFLHHADYSFSFGVHHPRAIHIDGALMQFRDCRDRLGISDNILVDYATEDRPRNPQPARPGARKLVTCTSATHTKLLRPGYRYTYPELVTWLLGQPTVERHVHIGLLPDPMLSDIHARLDRAGIARQRFDYRGNVPSYWATLAEAKVDVAVGSFPLGGGLTIIEALGSGTPYLVHQNYLKRTACELDMTYPEGFVWRTYHELSAALGALASGECARHSALARQWFEQNFTLGKLVSALSGEHIRGAEERSARPYVRDNLQAVLDTFFL